MNTKYLWIMLACFGAGLLAGTILNKDTHLREAVANLNTAHAKLEAAQQSLDRALQRNHELEKRNNDFLKYMDALDSTAKEKELIALRKEERLLRSLAQVNASMRELKVSVAKSGAHLFRLPVGELEEGN